jgi:hypothetical protein
MANEHPFQLLFETLGRPPIAHADSVNRQAYEVLHDILTVPLEKPGRCILLRAPRAGHGKTHLLSRIQHQLGSSHEFIPLHAAFGCQIDASTVIDDTLRRLLRPLPASGGLCVLDLVARRLFASALQPLVSSGEVPCQDRDGALTALRSRPIETFDFHHPNAVTAHWTRENFEVLGQRLSMELAQRCDLPVREVAFWVDALFRFAATPVDNPIRLRVLAEAIQAGNPGAGVLMERLEALLGLMSLLMRVVLVADDLEGFSTDETAALRLAAFLGSLRQSVERLDVVLSLNRDIWESAFVPRLSDGLADRLSEVVVELKPLTEGEMVALLESRVPGLGERVLSRVDREAAGTHARGLIRAAGVAWLQASAMDSQSRNHYTAPVSTRPPPPPPAPVVEPPPAAEAASAFEAIPEAPDSPSEPPQPFAPQEMPTEEGCAPSEDRSAANSTPQEEIAQESADFSNEPTTGFTIAPDTQKSLDQAEAEFAAPAASQDPSRYGTEPATIFEPAASDESGFATQATGSDERPEPANTDRVDDLLRQFRERYGRGSM